MDQVKKEILNGYAEILLPGKSMEAENKLVRIVAARGIISVTYLIPQTLIILILLLRLGIAKINWIN